MNIYQTWPSVNTGSSLMGGDYFTGALHNLDGTSIPATTFIWRTIYGSVSVSGNRAFPTPPGTLGAAVLSLQDSGISTPYGTIGFRTQFSTGSNMATTGVVGMMYGAGLGTTLAANSRFFGIKNSHLVLYATGPANAIFSRLLQDFGPVSLNNPDTVLLSVIRDSHYTRLSYGGSLIAEMIDPAIAGDGSMTASGIYMVADGNFAVPTHCNLFEVISLSPEPGSGSDLRYIKAMSFSSIDSCADYNMAYDYGRYNVKNLHIELLQDPTVSTRVDILEVNPSSDDLIDSVIFPPGTTVYNAAPNTTFGVDGNVTALVGRFRDLDGVGNSVYVTLEAEPYAFNGPPIDVFSTNPFYLARLLPTTGSAISAVYPLYNPSPASGLAARFYEQRNSTGCSFYLLGLGATTFGMAVTSSLDYRDYTEADKFGLMIGSSYPGTGYAVVTERVADDMFLSLYSTTSGSLTAILGQSPAYALDLMSSYITVITAGYHPSSGCVYASLRNDSETGAILTTLVAGAGTMKDYAGIINQTGLTLDSISFSAYPGKTYLQYYGVFRAYQAFQVDIPNAGNVTIVPASQGNNVLIYTHAGRDNNVYYVNGQVHSQDPVITGINSTALAKTGTQGLSGESIALRPDDPIGYDTDDSMALVSMKPCLTVHPEL